MSVASEAGVATSTTRLRAARTARRSRRKRGSHACEQVPRRFREASPKQPWGAFPPHPQGRLARQRAASHVGTGEGAQVAPEAALPRASKVEGFFERAELQLAPYNRGGLFTQWDTRHPSHPMPPAPPPFGCARRPSAEGGGRCDCSGARPSRLRRRRSLRGAAQTRPRSSCKARSSHSLGSPAERASEAPASAARPPTDLRLERSSLEARPVCCGRQRLRACRGHSRAVSGRGTSHARLRTSGPPTACADVRRWPAQRRRPSVVRWRARRAPVAASAAAAAPHPSRFPRRGTA